MMDNLDQFYEGIVTQDNRLRTQIYQDLVNFLQNPATPCKSDNFDRIVDGLVGWVNSSNFKVSLNGLELLSLLINRVGETFRSYVPNVLEGALNRLGDMHDEVREAAQDLLLRLMHPASSPSFVFDRIWPLGIIHKQFRVREGICICLQNLLNHYGAKSLQLNKIVPQLVKLMDDSNTQVREAALNGMAEIYRHVGEKVRLDLAKKGMPQAKLMLVMERFDEVRDAGDMLPTATRTMSASSRNSDDLDFAKPPVFQKPVIPKAKSAKPMGNGKAAGAGALSEDMFSSSFDQVPKVNIYSARDVEDKLQQAYSVLSNPNEDWEKRITMLKICRSVVLEGGANYDEFYTYLRQLETAFIQAVKDLRSQVVREACITIAFYAQNLETKFEHFCEMILPSLINLIPNSVKVMSTSGTTTLRFIVQSVQSPRLIPILVQHSTSKSNIIRRYILELIEALLGIWPTHCIERHIATLQDTIKRGIGDADNEARTFARKAFWLFSQHFKNHADSLYDSLDGARQKQLQGELSQSSSSNSVGSATHKGAVPLGRSQSQERTGDGSAFVDDTSPRDGNRRSARTLTSQRTGVAAHPRKTSAPAVAVDIMPSANGGSQKTARVSQSQPGSRSNSPSSRLFSSTTTPSTASGRRRKSGIPRSQGTSRETSPARYGFASKDRPTPGRTSSQSASPQLLDGTPDTEDLLAQKLGGTPGTPGFRRRYDYGSDDDANSETSSLCSDSLSTFGASTRCTDDVNDIVKNLLSSQWSERKEGLMQLLYFVTRIRSLTPSELKRVTEVFTRMFYDPHAKVFSIFMDTLVEVIQIHRHDLQDWLPTLITRMLTKCGGDMLASVATKAQKTLDTILETFDNVDQFNALMRFLADATQTVNFKVKLQYLNYLHSLILHMDTSEFVNSNDSRSSISKIIQWVAEPKNADIRKAAQSVIVTLFNLNPAEFSATTASLPKSFQDTAHKIIHSHVAGLTGNTDTPKNPLASLSTGGASRNTPPRASPRNRYPSGSSQHSDTPAGPLASRRMMNPEEIFQSIRQTTADIQNLSLNSKLEADDIGKERDSTSQDSGIQSSLPDVRDDSPDSTLKRQPYKPSNYTTPGTGSSVTASLRTNGYNKGVEPDNMYAENNDSDQDDMPLDPNEPLSKILEELSNHEERHHERMKAMDDLIKMARSGVTSTRWDEHFKTLLLLLLETLGDADYLIRTKALQVLRELIRHEKQRFDHYAELTLLKVLEAHKDSNKDVARAAEECASVLARSIRPEHSIVILAKLTETLSFPLNVAAIKMQTQVIELISPEALTAVLHRVVTGLIKGYEDDESSCRKASVFALVALHLKVGEALMPHLAVLNGSKMKLLNLYIKRAESQRSTGNAAASS